MEPRLERAYPRVSVVIELTESSDDVHTTRIRARHVAPLRSALSVNGP